eukprot:887812-Pyramimonas_sp.AAC.1
MCCAVSKGKTFAIITMLCTVMARLDVLCYACCAMRHAMPVRYVLCYDMPVWVFRIRFWLKNFRAAIADYTWRQSRCPAHLGN